MLKSSQRRVSGRADQDYVVSFDGTAWVIHGGPFDNGVEAEWAKAETLAASIPGSEIMGAESVASLYPPAKQASVTATKVECLSCSHTWESQTRDGARSCPKCQSTDLRRDSALLSGLTGHQRHVRWLIHQYALGAPQAEEEAQTRYVLYPQEIARWGVDPQDIHPELASDEDFDTRFKRYGHPPLRSWPTGSRVAVEGGPHCPNCASDDVDVDDDRANTMRCRSCGERGIMAEEMLTSGQVADNGKVAGSRTAFSPGDKIVLTEDDRDEDMEVDVPRGTELTVDQVDDGLSDGTHWLYVTYNGEDIVVDPGKVKKAGRIAASLVCYNCQSTVSPVYNAAFGMYECPQCQARYAPGMIEPMASAGSWWVVDDEGSPVDGPFDTQQEAVDQHDSLITDGRDSEDTWVQHAESRQASGDQCPGSGSAIKPRPSEHTQFADGKGTVSCPTCNKAFTISDSKAGLVPVPSHSKTATGSRIASRWPSGWWVVSDLGDPVDGPYATEEDAQRQHDFLSENGYADTSVEEREEVQEWEASRTAANTLTVADLEKTLNDDGHLGYGWAESLRMSDDAQAKLAELVIDQANAMDWTYAQLFTWSNSKHARWLCDESYERIDPVKVNQYVTMEGLETKSKRTRSSTVLDSEGEESAAKTESAFAAWLQNEVLSEINNDAVNTIRDFVTARVAEAPFGWATDVNTLTLWTEKVLFPLPISDDVASLLIGYLYDRIAAARPAHLLWGPRSAASEKVCSVTGAAWPGGQSVCGACPDESACEQGGRRMTPAQWENQHDSHRNLPAHSDRCYTGRMTTGNQEEWSRRAREIYDDPSSPRDRLFEEARRIWDGSEGPHYNDNGDGSLAACEYITTRLWDWAADMGKVPDDDLESTESEEIYAALDESVFAGLT